MEITTPIIFFKRDKVQPRTTQKDGRKSAILTDTPVKTALEELEIVQKQEKLQKLAGN